ncbi:MAG: hypothetical protein V2B18_16715, partial [Pseudomonadota bacterium]
MKSPLDVLLLCFDDNSNSMFRYWKCLKHLGLNAIAFKGRLHPFGYPVQVPLHPVLGNVPIKVYGPTTIMGPGLETLIQSAHVVHLFHSTYVLTPVDLKAKHVVVQHGGMAYRQYADQCNAVFNEIADATIVQCPDLLGLGAKNEHLIYYPVDTDFIQFNPKRRDRERIIFGHFPSNPGWKGTKEIMEVLKEFLEDPDYKDRIGVRCSMNPTPWLENLAMIKSCDVVIEAMRPEQKGHRYGEWGNTALESAASGALV